MDLLMPVGGLLGYLFYSFCLMVIANRTDTENGWLAFIPIANLYLMTQIVRKPWWWLLLMFIPIVGFVVLVFVTIGICEARKKPGWIGILIIVPIVNLVILPYLAFSE